jgi:hypothetical protein
VAGELSAEDEVRFEARLAEEPALARMLEQYEQTELLGTIAARARPGAATGVARRAAWPTLLLLAAAAGLIAGAMWWLGADGPECTMRVVATGGTDPAAYAAAIGLPEDVVVEGAVPRGAPATARVLPVAEFLREVAAAEVRGDAARFAAPQGQVGDRFATARFTVTAECSAVAVLARADRLQRAYPIPAGTFVFAPAANRFGPGTMHVLPRPVLVANAIGGLNLHPGFDLGPVATGPCTLVLAIRAAPVPEELLAALDERLAAGDLATVRAWLAEQGFVLREAVVRVD